MEADCPWYRYWIHKCWYHDNISIYLYISFYSNNVIVSTMAIYFLIQQLKVAVKVKKETNKWKCFSTLVYNDISLNSKGPTEGPSNWGILHIHAYSILCWEMLSHSLIQYSIQRKYFLIYCLIFRQYCTICIILYVKFRSLQQVSKQRRYYTSTQRRNTNSKKAIYLKSIYFILSIVHIFTDVSLKPYWYTSYFDLDL